MEVRGTPIEGLLVIQPKVWRDDRGFFLESYQARRYADAGLP
ncbi:MAG TPA: dTDP-4-dehydrorhamnose 3,5-epimerase family protein, partial [Candidatus Hydrogenedentes bacterium]|nr:dTDP-4-dehydrorhamnose 3,5-epimerase family protein [Candidatus Hydrogenedentota bacterium]